MNAPLPNDTVGVSGRAVALVVVGPRSLEHGSHAFRIGIHQFGSSTRETHHPRRRHIGTYLAVEGAL